MHLTEPKKLPSKRHQQIIEEHARQISDPVKKLKFLKLALSQFQKTPTQQFTDSLLSFFPKHIYIAVSVFVVFFIAGIGILISSYSTEIKQKNKAMTSTIDQEDEIFMPIIYPPVSQNNFPGTALYSRTSPGTNKYPEIYPNYLDKLIWLVEKTNDSEIYSNRLKIITTYTTSNIPRRYYRFLKDTPQLPTDHLISDEVRGLLYHASESDIYAFRPEMTESIKEYSKALVRYLSRKKAYHYFIDRFGRVYRVVRESDAAFHAGNAIWADEESIYLDLNHAFLGICFEGKDFQKSISSMKGSGILSKIPMIKPMDTASINEAQLISGKELTDWLRVKYTISQGNCVTHSLVSINPYNLLIGYHLDLSYGFPFDQYSLSNKYNEPIPAITEFGLSYDNYFIEIFDGNIWPGITYSENIVKKKAKEHNMSYEGYKKLLNKRFTNFYAWQRKKIGKPDQNNSQ